MAAQVETNRRRLTVGVGSEPDTAAAVALAKEDASGDADLADMLRATDVEAVSVSSTTDVHTKTHFQDKDIDVFTTGSKGSDIKAFHDVVKESSHIVAAAYQCRKGKKPEAPNQDSFSILLADSQFALYGVYDGHGPNGHDVSEVARKEVVKQFYRRHRMGDVPVKQAFHEAFTETQRLLEEGTGRTPKESKLDASMSGTTCTMVYHDMPAKKLWIAHVGDSRAVLGRISKGSEPKVEALTVDHKPDLPEERRRIEAAGGRVVFDGYYNHRVFSSKGHYPGLNMSRALGDVKGHEEAGLSPVPDIKELDLSELKSQEQDIILLLCTDGVWEFIDGGEAVGEVCPGGRTPQSSAELNENLARLTKASFDKWMQDSDNEISDDITGIAIIL